MSKLTFCFFFYSPAFHIRGIPVKYAGHEEEFLGWLTGTLWLMTFDRPFVKIVVARTAAATTTTTTTTTRGAAKNQHV